MSETLTLGGAVLSDQQITDRLQQDLIIHPLLHPESQITGCKVDLHLSGVFYEIRRTTVDSYDPVSMSGQLEYRREIILPLGGYIVLHPGDLILAPTFENVSVPRNLLGLLEGRSSLGRLGVIVHATASFIDPGFAGAVTLELSNLGHLPVRLYTLARVAAIAFLQVSGSVTKAYGDTVPSPFLDTEIQVAHYRSPVSEASKHHEDWEYEMIRRVNNKVNDI